MHVIDLNVPEFLDIVHAYLMLVIEKPEDRERINRELIGPPRINQPTIVDDRTGITPPSWWKGDTYASNSGLVAMMSLKR